MAIQYEYDKMPDFFDPNNPETWVKEDPNAPGQSVAVAMLGESSVSVEIQQ